MDNEEIRYRAIQEIGDVVDEDRMPPVHYHLSVRFSAVGYHYWNEAPPEYGYLSHGHRHEFVFRIAMAQVRSRDLEINAVAAMLKAKLEAAFSTTVRFADVGALDFRGRSCEDLAKLVLEQIWNIYHPDWARVTVLEDGLQGAGASY